MKSCGFHPDCPARGTVYTVCRSNALTVSSARTLGAGLRCRDQAGGLENRGLRGCGASRTAPEGGPRSAGPALFVPGRVILLLQLVEVDGDLVPQGDELPVALLLQRTELLVALVDGLVH